MDALRDVQKRKSFMSEKPAAYSWRDIFTLVLSQPSSATFELLLQDPAATAQRAYRWIFVSGAISLSLAFLLMSQNVADYVNAFTLTPLLGGAFFLISFVISNCFIQWMAKTFGGQGSYHDFHYLRASFVAPLSIFNGLLIPYTNSESFFVSLVSLALFAFQIFLTTLALKVINKFSWLQTFNVLGAALLAGLGLILAYLTLINMIL